MPLPMRSMKRAAASQLALFSGDLICVNEERQETQRDISGCYL
jgi:hypothetical protein